MAVTDASAPSTLTADDHWIISVALREFSEETLEAIRDVETFEEETELRRQAHRALSLAAQFEGN